MGTYLDIVAEFESRVRTNEGRSSDVPLKSEYSSNSFNSYSDNVVFGPWAPATQNQVAEERRRVLEEEPRRWRWKPRYRLAELERSGLKRADAIALVRGEADA